MDEFVEKDGRGTDIEGGGGNVPWPCGDCGGEDAGEWRGPCGDVGTAPYRGGELGGGDVAPCTTDAGCGETERPPAKAGAGGRSGEGVRVVDVGIGGGKKFNVSSSRLTSRAAAAFSAFSSISGVSARSSVDGTGRVGASEALGDGSGASSSKFNVSAEIWRGGNIVAGDVIDQEGRLH
jgi:hypothetical protein